MTDGCGSSTVCGSFTVEIAIGKSFDQISEITGEEVLKKNGRFPKEEEHCAFLAVETLQEAFNKGTKDKLNAEMGYHRLSRRVNKTEKIYISF